MGGTAPDNATDRQIQRLEAVLRARYRADFRACSWHGPTSLQRVVWQDPDTLALLANPHVVAAILHRHHIGSELALGSAMTLGRAVIRGMASNRPSYMFTACPNWKLRPHAPSLLLDGLYDMRLPDREQPQPFLVSADLLAAAARAMDSVQQVLGGQSGGGEDDDGIWEAIGTASTARLCNALRTLLSEDRAKLLLEGRANTTLRRMSRQCLEVMQYVDRLLAIHEGSTERVLGFGLVSHALDAKHLIATLVHAVQLGRTRLRSDPAGAACSTFTRLLEDAAGGALGGAAGALIRARLQQAVRLLSDRRGPLGLSAGDLRQALVARDPQLR